MHVAENSTRFFYEAYKHCFIDKSFHQSKNNHTHGSFSHASNSGTHRRTVFGRNGFLQTDTAVEKVLDFFEILSEPSGAAAVPDPLLPSAAPASASTVTPVATLANAVVVTARSLLRCSGSYIEFQTESADRTPAG